MASPSRRAVVSIAFISLLGASAVTAATWDAGGDGASAPAPAEATERFLALTADGEVPANGLREPAGVSETTAADGDEADCAAEDPVSANAPADPFGLLPDKPTGIMANGWCITPAGQQIDVLRFPLGLAATGDESKIVVSSDNGGMQGLTLIDTETLAPTTTPAANLFMGVDVTDDGTVWASGGNANRLFRWKLTEAGLVALDATELQPVPVHNALEAFQARGGQEPRSLPAGDGIHVSGYPGPMVRDGDLLFVAGTLSEPTGTGDDACPGGQGACGRVTILDVTTGEVVRRIPVGLDAIGLALDAEHDLLYVANWADEAGRGGTGGGSVSVVDISTPATALEVASVATGHHPSAVQISGDGNRLFVANTNDDTISIYDISGAHATAPVLERVDSVSPITGVPVGAHPDAFALSPDGTKLFVALAGINAVEVRDGLTGAQSGIDEFRSRYIPTGWYPSALLVTGTDDDYRLWVTNAKGTGPGPGVNLSVGWNGNRTNGSVSVIDFPEAEVAAEQLTEAVFENDGFEDAEVDPCDPGSDVRLSEVLCPTEGESPIKHVVYIVTENKTFDQYFGDLPASDGWRADPKWILYSQEMTPNHHALAPRYSLGDNFFSDAEVSVTGHSWTSGAIATDYNERTWEADYDEGIRGSHGNGDPLRPGVLGTGGATISGADQELEDPEGGYIFEAFRRAGAVPPAEAAPDELSMAIYGEGTARTSEFDDWSEYQARDWKKGDIQYFDTCRALQFINGQAPDGPAPTFSNGATLTDCEGRTLPEQFTLQHWIDRFNAGQGDRMPSFIYMTLPVNHTLGTNLGSPTPASMVADNDYALGLIIEALSKSPFWTSTVVIQTEDDTQAAGDHISALRDYVQVVSPWAEPGPNHQWGSMPSILRTIEVLFGVDPISLFDRLALPLHEAFQASSDGGPGAPDPYTAIRPKVPFAVNEPGATASEVSEAMDWSTYDRIDEATLNAILYSELRGWPLRLPDHSGG